MRAIFTIGEGSHSLVRPWIRSESPYDHCDLRSWDQVTIHRRSFSENVSENALPFFPVRFYDSSRFKYLHRLSSSLGSSMMADSQSFGMKQQLVFETLNVSSWQSKMFHSALRHSKFQFSVFCKLEVPCWFCLWGSCCEDRVAGSSSVSPTTPQDLILIGLSRSGKTPLAWLASALEVLQRLTEDHLCISMPPLQTRDQLFAQETGGCAKVFLRCVLNYEDLPQYCHGRRQVHFVKGSYRKKICRSLRNILQPWTACASPLMCQVGPMTQSCHLRGICWASENLRFFLAQRGFKVANYPVIPDEDPPEQLFDPSLQLLGPDTETMTQVLSIHSGTKSCHFDTLTCNTARQYKSISSQGTALRHSFISWLQTLQKSPEVDLCFGCVCCPKMCRPNWLFCRSKCVALTIQAQRLHAVRSARMNLGSC